MTTGTGTCMLAVAWVSLVACGEDSNERSSAPTPGAPATPAAPLVAEAGERRVVALVNERPVYEDCVVARAREYDLPARDALRECVDFELLAERAEADGFAAHPDVESARKRESVRALLEQDFEPTFDGPEDVSVEQLEMVWKRPAVFYRYNHPEYRSSYYVRVELPKNEPRGSEADRRAEATARKIYQALAGRELTPDEFREQARAAADGTPLATNDKVYQGARDRTEKAYGNAVFAVEKLNTVSKPARTTWGWDVILLTKIRPAQTKTLADVEANLRKQVFPSARKRAFSLWLEELVGSREVTVFDERVPGGGPMSGLALPASSPPAKPAANEGP